MPKIAASDKIVGVKFSHLQAHSDARGRFMETFRKEWFPERSWANLQANRSESHAGVLRGLHYHFRQVDYWSVAVGSIRVGLADLRRDSATYGASQVVEIGDHNQMGVFIPPGVAHGFYALSAATLIYLVDQYYDASDEHGVVWNDPDLAVNWEIDTPILSDRDRELPLLKEIQSTLLP